MLVETEKHPITCMPTLRIEYKNHRWEPDQMSNRRVNIDNSDQTVPLSFNNLFYQYEDRNMTSSRNLYSMLGEFISSRLI